MSAQEVADDLPMLAEASIDWALNRANVRLDAFPLDRAVAWRLLRASYARGYMQGLRDPDPATVLRAGRYVDETVARLPVP